MELTRKLIEEKHLFTKCVICKHVFLPEDPNPRSDEHLIPEFLGGKLKVGMLCKQCNNDMGGGFEDRMATSFLSRAHANQYQIKGKSGNVPNSPLVGSYEHGGKTIFLDRNYKVKTQFSVECIQDDSEAVIFSGVIDATDLQASKKEVSKKVMRTLKKRGGQISEKSVYDHVSTIIDKSPINVQESPMLEKRIHIDLNDIDLLLLKISYEALCIHFGELITDDEFFQAWRTSLKMQKLDASIEYGNKPFFEFFLSALSYAPLPQLASIINFDEFEKGDNRNNVIIILFANAVFVRCLGFWGNFRINKNVPICLYEHSVLDKKLRCYEDEDFFLKLINQKDLSRLDPLV